MGGHQKLEHDRVGIDYIRRKPLITAGGNPSVGDHMTMLTKRMVGLAAFGGAVYLGWRALPQKTRDAVGQAVPVTVLGIGAELLRVLPSMFSAMLRDGRSLGGRGLRRFS